MTGFQSYSIKFNPNERKIGMKSPNRTNNSSVLCAHRTANDWPFKFIECQWTFTSKSFKINATKNLQSFHINSNLFMRINNQNINEMIICLHQKDVFRHQCSIAIYFFRHVQQQLCMEMYFLFVSWNLKPCLPENQNQIYRLELEWKYSM